jgi:hypothetical protein
MDVLVKDKTAWSVVATHIAEQAKSSSTQFLKNWKGKLMEMVGITFWLLAIGVIYLATQLGKRDS